MEINGDKNPFEVSKNDKNALKEIFRSLIEEAADKAHELSRREPKKVIKRRYSAPRDVKYTKSPRRSSRLSGRSPVKVESEVDLDDSDEESGAISNKVFRPRIRIRQSTGVPPPKALPVEEITEEMIERIHKWGPKEYHSVHGIMCHQCRQKTLDTKTMCRSPRCSGGQGAFCGPCLRNQYGESVEEALKDPNWSCPPCRNICICSMHMNMRGLPPAGIVIPLARKLGYNSVLDYLVAKEIIKLGEEGIII